jgi:actin-like protein 6A
VGDVGSHTSKFGFAGEDMPKHVFRSAGGLLTADHGGSVREGRRKRTRPAAATDGGSSGSAAAAAAAAAAATAKRGQWFVGDQSLSHKRDHVEVKSPLENGLLTDWELIEELWEHAFALLRAQPHEWPVLSAESSWSTYAQREKHMELMFETFQSPAMYIAKAGALSAFSAGRPTALICECSHSGSSATPVVEGRVLSRSVRRNDRGGAWLAKQTLRLLQEQGTKVAPRCAVKSGPTGRTVHLTPKTHSSYVQYWQEDVALDLLRAHMRVPPSKKPGSSDSPSSSAASSSESSEQDEDAENSGSDAPAAAAARRAAAGTYELPDGTRVTVTPELKSLPGALFAPPAVLTAPTGAAQQQPQPQQQQQLPMQQLCVAAVGAADGDVRRELLSNIVLSGATALLRGTPERLSDEVGKLLPAAFKTRVLAPAGVERQFSSWIGGSILSCLGTFQQLWLSKAEYDEMGPKRADQRFG